MLAVYSNGNGSTLPPQLSKCADFFSPRFCLFLAGLHQSVTHHIIHEDKFTRALKHGRDENLVRHSLTASSLPANWWVSKGLDGDPTTKLCASSSPRHFNGYPSRRINTKTFNIWRKWSRGPGGWFCEGQDAFGNPIVCGSVYQASHCRVRRDYLNETHAIECTCQNQCNQPTDSWSTWLEGQSLLLCCNDGVVD